MKLRLEGLPPAARVAPMSYAPILAVLGSQAAIFSRIATALCDGFLCLLPQTGFRCLLGGIATHVATTPLSTGILSRLIDRLQPVVPGHPHNMPLQIWAETGFIGAVIAAFALLALAFRLPRPETLRPEVRLAASGLIGAVLCHATFSYSVWNEAFWSSVFLAVAALILFSNSKAADA